MQSQVNQDTMKSKPAALKDSSRSHVASRIYYKYLAHVTPYSRTHDRSYLTLCLVSYIVTASCSLLLPGCPVFEDAEVSRGDMQRIIILLAGNRAVGGVQGGTAAASSNANDIGSPLPLLDEWVPPAVSVHWPGSKNSWGRLIDSWMRESEDAETCLCVTLLVRSTSFCIQTCFRLVVRAI